MPATVVLEHRDTGIAADHNSWAVAVVWYYAAVKEIAIAGMKVSQESACIVESSCLQVFLMDLRLSSREPYPVEVGE